jgi:hypothetical protein
MDRLLTHTSRRPGLYPALCLTLAILLGSASAASAQSSDDVKVTIYPVFAWVPTSINIDLNLPPFDGGGGGSGGGDVEIVDSRFDGAFLGGIAVTKGLWRVDAEGLWAAVGGDRPELPFLQVDADVFYLHGAGGIRVAPDFYVTGGVRYLALKYDIRFAEQPSFQRKPSITDPLVGLGYHHVGDAFEVHGTFEGGGFGVGADVDLSWMARIDWKPVSHFGLTAGYNFLYFKVDNEVGSRTLTVKQTLHGPIVGIGLYF